MILFLNFAPFDFAGGAERWMIDISSAVKKLEKVTLIDVHQSISNIYGRIVLKRAYDPRIDLKSNKMSQVHISLTLLSFIPWTRPWRQARSAFVNSRRIYIRYELLETLIVLYFGGLTAFKKTIAGIHSPFIYSKPITFLDRVHNLVYTSKISRWFLSRMHKVHVLNLADLKFFTEIFNLRNIVHVSNYITMKNENVVKQKVKENNLLHIAYVGEMSRRKGTDILIETIKNSSNDFVFHIAGDGPMRKEIEKLTSLHRVSYQGYLQENKLTQLYNDCDVLFVPSRAESFSLVCLEAMSYGLPIVSSPETHIGVPAYAQIINTEETCDGYLTLFKDMLIKKRNGQLIDQKNKVYDYVKKTFSRDVVVPQLLKQVFEIKTI